MEQNEQFNDFLRRISTDNHLISHPTIVDQSGVYRVVGFNHVITCEFEQEKYKDGINYQEALEIFDKEIQLCERALISRYNEISEKYQYDALNLGCQRLLLFLLYSTGNIKQFDKVIEECQNDRLSEAIKFSCRKNIMDNDENQKLQFQWEEEKNYFMKNFDKFGNPKEEIQAKIKLIQHSEEDENNAEFFIKQRQQVFKQGDIVPLNSSFTKVHYLSKEFLEFIKDQQGCLYNYSSFNESNQKWFPVGVPDQSFKIIGYSHRCSKEEEQRFSVGLDTEHVNHLFLLDYQKNCTLLKRYLQCNHPKFNFEELSSQTQLFLIDIAFRNLAFSHFEEAIQLALEENVYDAIEACNMYYRPDLEVHVHYNRRREALESFIKLVDEEYYHQSKCDWNDEKYNNIVGIKMNSQGFQFIFDENATNKIRINDLITCLKVLYDPELDEDSKILYFSLEFEDNDFEMENQFQKKVYFPEYLEGSEIGEILYESDFILKQMSLGIEVVNQSPLQVQEFDYGTLPIKPLYKIDPDYFARLFIKYGQGDLKIVDDSMNDYRSYVIEDIKLVVDAKYLDENGQDHQIQDPENAAVIFSNNFAKLYDDIAKRYPIFARLKEVFMANMLAKYMYNQKLKIDYKFVNEKFQQNLIQNYKKSQSPTLRMIIENDIMEFNLTGGVTTDTQNPQQEVDKIIQQQRAKPVTSQTETQIKTDDATFNIKVTELDRISNISTQPSQTDLNDFFQKKSCESCKNQLEQSEQDSKYCNACQGLRCQECQQNKNSKAHLKKVQDKMLCNSCIKCLQCGKTIDAPLEGNSQLLHDFCAKIFNESTLKTEMKGLIKVQLSTVKKMADNNNTQLYYFPEECKCIKLRYYTNYVVGFFQPIIEMKPQTTFNKFHYKIREDQASQQLEADLQKFQSQMVEIYKVLRKKINEIEEKVMLIQLFVLFVMKDELNVDFQNILQIDDYKRLLQNIQKELKCPNKTSHNCHFEEKIHKIKEFMASKENQSGQKVKSNQSKKQKKNK